MTLRLLHVIDSSLPKAGQMHATLPGLLDQLLRIGIDSQALAIESQGCLRVQHWRSDAAHEDWRESSASDIGTLVSRADLVHFHGIKRLEFKPLFLAIAQNRTPYVISPHAALIPNPWQRVGLWNRLKSFLAGRRRRYRKASSLHAAVSAEGVFLRDQGFNAHVEIIPWGVGAEGGEEPTLSRTHPQLAGRRCMLFLGRLHPVEGLVPMLKACEEVVCEAKEWHLILAGSQSQNWFKMIQAAVERRNLTCQVTMMIDPNLSQQRALLRHCEVVLQPSLLAGSPISALSGLICGKPCVVSTQCDLSEVTTIHAGWEAEPNRSALTSVLAEVVSASSEQLREMGRRGYDWVVANRSWEALAPRYKAYYLSLVNKH